MTAVLSSILLLSSAAVAATSDSVTLGGTVAPTLAIAATPTAGASTLDLDGEGSAGEHIVKVADLAILTNNEAGYTLTVTSGNITKADASPIAYQVTTVGDGASAPASGDFLIPSGTDYTFATNGASLVGDADQDLYIKYTPAALQDPGDYAATINLTVEDN